MWRLVVVSGALVACSPSHGGPDAAADYPVQQFLEDLRSVRCEHMAQCALVPDRASCLTLDASLGGIYQWGPESRDAAIDFYYLRQAIDAGVVGYRPHQAHACIGAMAQVATCMQRAAFAAPDACKTVFAGTIGDGEPCVFDEECISQACNGPFSTAGGDCPLGVHTCVGSSPPQRHQLGEACTARGGCYDGYCDPATSLCVAYLQSGCHSDDECAIGTSCGTDGTCVAMPLLGEACPNDACRDVFARCDFTACNGSACGTCDQVPPAANHPRRGEPCTAQCVDDSFCLNGVCSAPQQDGASCQSAVFTGNINFACQGICRIGDAPMAVNSVCIDPATVRCY